MVFRNSDKFLAALAVRNNLDIEQVIAGYLIMGEQFHLLLHVFEGKDIHIPSKRRLSSPSLHNVRYIEDDGRKYDGVRRYDDVSYDGKVYVAISEERKFLNHWYLPVIPKEEKKCQIR